MPAYNAFDFDPPAPVALVTFVHPDTGQRMDNVPMLLDTGADASIVPQVVVTALGMSERTKAYEVTFLEGDTATLHSTHLQMKWLRLCQEITCAFCCKLIVATEAEKRCQPQAVSDEKTKEVSYS